MTTFKDFLCVQIRGTARLFDGDDPDFERIMIELLPYEFGARCSCRCHAGAA